VTIPLPTIYREEIDVTNETIIREWRVATESAIASLESWGEALARWERQGCDRGEFHAALFGLRAAGLEGWTDQNKAGGGLDALAKAATGIDPLADLKREVWEQLQEGRPRPSPPLSKK